MYHIQKLIFLSNEHDHAARGTKFQFSILLEDCLPNQHFINDLYMLCFVCRVPIEEDSSAFVDEIAKLALIMVYIGIGTCILGFVFVSSFNIVSENQVNPTLISHIIFSLVDEV